jgi:PAS domain S-box-containing protein
MQAVTQAGEACKPLHWVEVAGRADELVGLLGKFVQDAPMGDRLAPALQTAVNLARLLEQGYLSSRVDLDLLPECSADWLIVLAGETCSVTTELVDSLVGLGFAVVQTVMVEDAIEACQKHRTVMLAPVSWLDRNAERLRGAFPASNNCFDSFPLLVALADTGDFRAQIKARQMGARLFLDLPVSLAGLLAELAGLAWMPRRAYRVLVVDDDRSVLQLHAAMLRTVGCEVLAIDDPVAARDILEEFAPEACVLDVEMPACRGTDLAALLSRDKRFAHLPIIYLSAFADTEHQLDARWAGGEDYLIKPVDERLLVTAVMARARKFRMFEVVYRQRRQAWRELENLKKAMDMHAIVSVAAADGSITDANLRFCEISGYSRDELIGHNHRVVKSGYHPASFFDEMWQTISTGRIWQGEVQNRSKSGRRYWVQNTIAPILDDHGVPQQYISIRTDITESKSVLAERERQTRLLDVLRKALQRFIVSQDIASTSTVLLDGMRLLTGSAYGFIGEVRHDPNGAPYLLTHAISDLAREGQTKTSDFELRDLDTLYGSVLRTEEIVLVNDPANDPRSAGFPDGHPAVEAFLGVPILFGNTLVGMVGFANRPSGYDMATVAFLDTFLVAYASILEAARLRQFQVQAFDDLQRARDAAVQADRAKTEFLAGWGHDLRTPLNVMLGHAQLLLMNDELEDDARDQVREIVQGGQQFARLIGDLIDRIDTEALAAASPLPGKRGPSPSEKTATHYRILVAEDNPANQAVLRMQLGVLGFEADIAVDGAAALAKWKAGGHDLILVDRNMPVMDGLELTRAIRANERESGAHVPIVAITAVQQEEELAHCQQAGMDDALPKPIELEALRQMLARWLPQIVPTMLARLAGTETGASQKEVVAALDLDYLVRIVGNADAKQIRELIDLFMSTARDHMPACRRHLTDRNGRELALVMHKLKSSARMVGALRFASLAEAIEEAAKGARLPAAAALVSELDSTLDDIEFVINRSGISLTPTGVSPLEPAPSQLPHRVLVVDDDPVARSQIALLLSTIGVREVLTVNGAEVALKKMSEAGGGFDLLITDINMPGMDGIQFLRHLAEIDYRGCLILSSGVEDRLLQSTVEWVGAKGLSLRGALKKPVTRDALLDLLTKRCELLVTSQANRVSSVISPNDILKGIRHDEFVVHFQPKVDAATLRVVGVEALARWQSDGPLVPPDAFIVAAERHDLIGPLSEMLLTKALVGGARLADEGFPLTVAVNVSANWLSDVRLPEFVLASIHATGFKAEHLVLEITETGVMADMATALDVMTRLRLKGFKLSIDDFGTGYSSLEQLQRIPFSELKLDRSFVRGAAEKPAARAILSSTLEMAKKLKLATVAEGVETQQDLDLVRGLGCDLVQGWFVAKAMPLDELIKWLRVRSQSEKLK